MEEATTGVGQNGGDSCDRGRARPATVLHAVCEVTGHLALGLC